MKTHITTMNDRKAKAEAANRLKPNSHMWKHLFKLRPHLLPFENTETDRDAGEMLVIIASFVSIS